MSPLTEGQIPNLRGGSPQAPCPRQGSLQATLANTAALRGGCGPAGLAADCRRNALLLFLDHQLLLAQVQPLSCWGWAVCGRFPHLSGPSSPICDPRVGPDWTLTFDASHSFSGALGRKKKKEKKTFYNPKNEISILWQLMHFPPQDSTLKQSSECLTLILNRWLSGGITWLPKKHTDVIIKEMPILTGSWRRGGHNDENGEGRRVL